MCRLVQPLKRHASFVYFARLGWYYNSGSHTVTASCLTTAVENKITSHRTSTQNIQVTKLQSRAAVRIYGGYADGTARHDTARPVRHARSLRRLPLVLLLAAQLPNILNEM